MATRSHSSSNGTLRFLSSIKKNQVKMLALLSSVKKEQNRLRLQITRNYHEIKALKEDLGHKPNDQIIKDTSFVFPALPIGNVPRTKLFNSACERKTYCDQIVSNS